VKPGTGLHPRPSDGSALKVHFPEIDDSWPSLWYPSRKGEDVAVLHDRLAGFITDFVSEVQRRFSGVHERVLFVTHAATAIALTRELVGDRGLMFSAACCSLTVLDHKDAAEKDSARPAIVGDWTPRSLGDCAHLKDGSQRAWGFHKLKTDANGEVSSRFDCEISISWGAIMDSLSHVRVLRRLSSGTAYLGRKMRRMSLWAHRPRSWTAPKTPFYQ